VLGKEVQAARSQGGGWESGRGRGAPPWCHLRLNRWRPRGQGQPRPVCGRRRAYAVTRSESGTKRIFISEDHHPPKPFLQRLLNELGK
jgi:hypothetical protein